MFSHIFENNFFATKLASVLFVINYKLYAN